VSPQRRTALVSVVAAAVLIALKLSAGLAAHSLGLVSEALHSGTDLVAALLTFFAVGVSGRPADTGHQYGHGKAEHLSALGEATILTLASLLIGFRSVQRLAGSSQTHVDVRWYAFVVIALVLVVDASRTVVSLRGSRRYASEALRANALHFASDMAGSVAVLGGLVAASAGHPRADAVAALFVAVLVLLAATRLIRRNVDVLMDRIPADSHGAATAAIAALDPPVELRRLRMRQAGGRFFADVVIGVSPGAAVGQGHAAADAVERAVEAALPGTDVVVHVEPRSEESKVSERVHEAALSVRGVREIHNVAVIQLGDRLEVSLHLKLPGDLPLDAAHELAERVEEAICAAVPEVDAVQTHLEPLAEAGPASLGGSAELEQAVRAATRDELGTEPREVRFLETQGGLVLFLTLAFEPGASLAESHARAGRVEERIRRHCPDLAEIVVHTEPAA
jgi:cation diffusion facilitator family transporter